MNELSFKGNTVEISNNVTLTTPFDIKNVWSVDKVNYIIVLMDPNANLSVARFENIIAYDKDSPSDIKWSVELPTSSGPDCYTEAEVIEGTMSAFSFSCFRCVIDLETGRIISKSFSK